MSKIVKVNWVGLKKISDSTIKDATDFETARKKFQEIILSIPECWEGIDSNNFIANCNNFLEELKNDSIYLNMLGEYFDKSSKAYGNTVNKHSEKMKKMNTELLDEKSKYNLVDMTIVNSSTIGGDINGFH